MDACFVDEIKKRDATTVSAGCPGAEEVLVTAKGRDEQASEVRATDFSLKAQLPCSPAMGHAAVSAFGQHTPVTNLPAYFRLNNLPDTQVGMSSALFKMRRRSWVR